MKKLKELRKLSKLTQVEVARILNIHVITYSKYETGRTEPNIDMLIKLADLFHTTIDYMLGREVNNINLLALSNDKADIINQIVSMKDNDIEKVKAFIAGLNSK